MTRKHHRRLPLRSFYVWHRYLGVSAALLVMLLAVTGVLLNHTEDFRFDERHVKTEWVLDWYGIEAPDQATSFRAGERLLTLFGRRLYLDTRALEGEYERLIGALSLPDMLVVAADQTLLLLTPTGELIERLDGSQGVPTGMKRIGTDADGRPVVEGNHSLYQPDADFLSWQRWEGADEEVRWAEPGPPPDELLGQLARHFRGEVVPVERLLLDLHSGRFFGSLGVYVMDAAALVLLFLALSGSFLWWQQGRKRRAHRRARKNTAPH